MDGDMGCFGIANLARFRSYRRSFRYGEHGAWEEVRAIRAKEFTVHTRRPRPVNCDGEIVTETPARFTIKPRAVTVFAPAP